MNVRPLKRRAKPNTLPKLLLLALATSLTACASRLPPPATPAQRYDWSLELSGVPRSGDVISAWAYTGLQALGQRHHGGLRVVPQRIRSGGQPRQRTDRDRRWAGP